MMKFVPTVASLFSRLARHVLFVRAKLRSVPLSSWSVTPKQSTLAAMNFRPIAEETVNSVPMEGTREICEESRLNCLPWNERARARTQLKLSLDADGRGWGGEGKLIMVAQMFTGRERFSLAR